MYIAKRLAPKFHAPATTDKTVRFLSLRG